MDLRLLHRHCAGEMSRIGPTQPSRGRVSGGRRLFQTALRSDLLRGAGQLAKQAGEWASRGRRGSRMRLAGLRIRSRIYLFQLLVGLSVLLISAVVLTTIQRTNDYLLRVEWANRQLEAITALTVNANRFAEQIAEYLLIGELEREDFESAPRGGSRIRQVGERDAQRDRLPGGADGADQGTARRGISVGAHA